MSWQAIPAINALQEELDDRWPDRVTPDWIIGDPAHSARISDHNPASDGDVHAIDIRHGDGLDVRELRNVLIGDHRLKYVISEWVIYSRTYGWRANRYTGSNGHTTHLHASFRYEPEHENDTSRFFDDRKARVKPMPIDLSIVRDEFLRVMNGAPPEQKVHIQRLQRALNVTNKAGLQVDGYVGPNLLKAWGDWERRTDVPGRGRPRVPDAKSLAALVLPRWRMIE